MSRDDAFRVRSSSIPAVGESTSQQAIINRFGSQIVTDFYTQLLLSGFCFHIQTGNEDAPVTTNGPMDDADAGIVADCTSGSMMPLLFEYNVAVLGAGTLAMAMLEADMDKVRYTSGGTVYVPEQMNKAATSADAAAGTFRTIEGSDIVTAGKSAVPASVELARIVQIENAMADTLGYPGGWNNEVFNVRNRTPVILTNPGSLCAHFGADSGDPTGYAVLQFAQFPTALAY